MNARNAQGALRIRVGRVTALVALSAFCAVSGCGPSVQSVYEGDVRFEHCYRLDLDPSITASHREICWREWMARYTYGQTRDKLAYARRRIEALKRDPAHIELDIEPAQADPVAVASPAVPVPQSAHHTPPPTMSDGVAAPGPAAPGPAAPGPAAPGPAAPGPAVRGAQCGLACGDALLACQSGCTPQSGGVAPCPDCVGDYRGCLTRCYAQ